MAQDLRKLLKDKSDAPEKELPTDHLLRFEARLDKALPIVPEQSQKKQNSSNRLWMKIAAVLVIALGILWFANSRASLGVEEPKVVDANEDNQVQERPVLLSDISPDFKKVEDYYTGNIKLELARLDITDDNQELIDSFMLQLEKLDVEYKKLNAEVVEVGLSEETVAAMIDNLKLRLELLFKLKSKLKELKAVPKFETA